MSEEKKPTPSTNIPLLSYRKSEQQEAHSIDVLKQHRIYLTTKWFKPPLQGTVCIKWNSIKIIIEQLVFRMAALFSICFPRQIHHSSDHFFESSDHFFGLQRTSADYGITKPEAVQLRHCSFCSDEF